MDHHCPWTANCVSHRILPHFVRFVCYSVMATMYLEYFLYIRLEALWSKRNLPSYLGPSISQLILLFILSAANTITCTGLTLLFLRAIWCIAINTTTIEGWEKERHETVVRRAKRHGGVLDGPNGTQIRIVKQEFPYDIGIFSNFAQVMGTKNVLLWPWPFVRSLPIDSGLVFDENGFEDEGTFWPPPDPDRMFSVERKVDPVGGFTQSQNIEDFRLRQAADVQRYATDSSRMARRKPYYVRLEEQARPSEDRTRERVHRDSDYYHDGASEEQSEDGSSHDEGPNRKDGEAAWRNAEGERLADFGVDEDAEFYDDEDNIPLAKLLELRRAEREQEIGQNPS